MAHRYTALHQIASAQTQLGKTWPNLLVFSDPVRNPANLELVAQIPVGAGLVYRHFGAKDRKITAQKLAKACAQKGVVVLIGADADLAYAVGADGVHLPQRMIGALPRIRHRFSFSIISAAAHTVCAARRALALGADFVIVSPVFSSNSPSAGRALGLVRFGAMVQKIDGPVLALGGINLSNAKHVLPHTMGIAVVSAGNTT